MQEILHISSRDWTVLLARPSGPFAFRFVRQPLMAALLAVRDGVSDGRTGRSPFFRTTLHDPAQPRERLVEAMKATAKIGALAILIDVVYQLRGLGTFYADAALVVAVLLALVPYALIRGPMDRITRQWIDRRTSRQEAPKHEPPARTT